MGPESRRKGRRRARGAAFAALLSAGLMLAPARAGAADGTAASGPQAGDRSHRVSPYARFARENQQLVGKNPARKSGVSGTRSVGHASRSRQRR